MCRLWRVAESNVTMSELFLTMDLKPTSTTTTKTHWLTEVKVVARIFLLPSHPSHSASWVIMEEDCAMEVTDKNRAILSKTLKVSRLQAY
jgi:hypothetical protein